VFVIEPFNFEQEYANALTETVAPPGRSRRLPDTSRSLLVHMKEQVGRARDLDDVQHLRWIAEERSK
jgi:hypothetical protein